MTYTGALIILIVIEAVRTGIDWYYSRMWKKQLADILINQKTLVSNDKTIRESVELTLQASIKARDHCADIKQEINSQGALD